MNTLSLHCFSLLFCCLVLAFGGCSKSDKPEGFPRLYSAAIIVKQEDRELPDASVRLLPLDTSNSWVTGAVTDAHGKASLRTHGKYPGAPAGKYKVCLSSVITEGAVVYSEKEKIENPKLEDIPGTAYHTIGKEYNDPQSTPFELEILPDKNNTFEFNIPQTVKIKIPYTGAN